MILTCVHISGLCFSDVMYCNLDSNVRHEGYNHSFRNMKTIYFGGLIVTRSKSTRNTHPISLYTDDLDLLRLGYGLLCLGIISHLLLDPSDCACTSIDYGSVHLRHACSRIKDLARLPPIGDSSGCKDDFAWGVRRRGYLRRRLDGDNRCRFGDVVKV